MPQKSHYDDATWDAFDWMLKMREVLRDCRSACFRTSVGAKPHAQDKIDAKKLEADLRMLFPYPWEGTP